jgi:hypothetical protein
MWAIVRTEEEEPIKPLTPEEKEFDRKIESSMGWVMLVVTIVFFGVLTWALIATS